LKQNDYSVTVAKVRPESWSAVWNTPCERSV